MGIGCELKIEKDLPSELKEVLEGHYSGEEVCGGEMG